MFFCAGHLFHVGSRLQLSDKVGVLVSMVFGSHIVTVLLLFSVSSEDSEQGAQRSARAEKYVGRRGRKTCSRAWSQDVLAKSRTWNQLAPCGLQPGPLALSCMAMTMHTGESLALFHSHADSFVITNDFW